MTTAIILAGGTGTRIGADVPKQFIPILGKPVLAYTLELFQNNENIDAIEIVCHKDWVDEVERIVTKYDIHKTRWITTGGDTFQESTMRGIFHLEGQLSEEDIVTISFGVAPMTPQADIDDNIRVCKLHGNAISAQTMDLCTCIIDDEESTTQNILRETLRGFANPWSFRYGEVLSAYRQAMEMGILEDLEPHTTSLYFALGKRLWFSRCTAINAKITHKQDLDVFEGYLLLQEKRKNEEGSL